MAGMRPGSGGDAAESYRAPSGGSRVERVCLRSPLRSRGDLPGEHTPAGQGMRRFARPLTGPGLRCTDLDS